MGELIIRWTARLAVACYAARLMHEVAIPSNAQKSASNNSSAARGWWTFGCVIFTIHVAAAFHFEHQWSHAHAYAYTAQRTVEMTGWNSGVGLYIDEMFLALWMVDAFAWWWRPRWHQNRFVYWTVQAIFAFLMFQATAVFGPPFWRPLVAAFLLLLWGLYRRRSKSQGLT